MTTAFSSRPKRAGGVSVSAKNPLPADVRRMLRAFVVGALALTAMALLTPTPAAAGDYGYRHYGYGKGYGRGYGRHYHKGYYRDRYGRHPRRRYGRYRGHPRYGRGGLSGGEAALIAAGIIGGVILIDRALEWEREEERARAYADARARERARRRFYEERGYGPYGDDVRGDDRLDRERRQLERERRELEADRRAFEAERRRSDRPDFERPRREEPDFDDRRQRDNAPDALDDELEDSLLGASGRRITAGVSNNRFVRAAYGACVRETRRAAASEGLMIALPGEPALADVDAAGVYRLEADFTADDGAGSPVRRTMRCEADEAGVAFLEIV